RGSDDPTALAEMAGTALEWRLGQIERGFLLMVAARAAEPDNLEALALAVTDGAGAPVPALDHASTEARDWAAWASATEVKAYLAACWHRLSAKDRKAFLKAARQV